MKKHVYLFDESSRAAVYGIGTYIRQMITCLISIPDTELHIVIISADAKHFELKEEQGYTKYEIPKPCIPVGEKDSVFERNVCYLLRLNCKVTENDEYIFLFNYTKHLVLAVQLKECFPTAFFCFTVHYQNWCFDIDGDVLRFKQIVHAKDATILSTLEQDIYNAYIKERELLQHIDKVICLSEFTRTLLNEEYGLSQDKLILIYNGLKDEGNIVSTEERNSLKKQLHFSTKEKIILFVGRLDAIKGVDTLLMSFCDMLHKNKNYRLVIIGDGDYSSCLNKCGNDWKQVTFTGRLSKEQLYHFYQIADIGVMPSMHEQCSYVAIEMMMFGLPMVISTTTGLKEMMQFDDFGYTFNMKNDCEETRNELTNLVTKVLNAPFGKRKKMRSISRSYYEEKYSEQDMQKKYFNLIFSDQY